MLKAVGLCKDYRTESGRWHRVLSDVSLTVHPGEKVAILGRNGAGKSTLIRLLGGGEPATRGTVERTMSVSWPVGLAGGLGGSMTGHDNIRFLARIYGKNYRDLVGFVDDFAELGRYLSEPVRTYSTGMRARLNFALSFAFDFDCYLIDEVIAAGDQRFQQRSHDELFEKRADRSLVFASHIPTLVRNYCSRALILHRGRAKMFDDLDLATDIYNDL